MNPDAGASDRVVPLSPDARHHADGRGVTGPDQAPRISMSDRAGARATRRTRGCRSGRRRSRRRPRDSPFLRSRSQGLLPQTRAPCDPEGGESPRPRIGSSGTSGRDEPASDQGLARKDARQTRLEGHSTSDQQHGECRRDRDPNNVNGGAKLEQQRTGVRRAKPIASGTVTPARAMTSPSWSFTRLADGEEHAECDHFAGRQPRRGAAWSESTHQSLGETRGSRPGSRQMAPPSPSADRSLTGPRVIPIM